MTFGRAEIDSFLHRQDETLFAFYLRHPELLETAVRRDAQRRLAVGERPLPSVAEVLAEARLVAVREREHPTAPPPPTAKRAARPLPKTPPATDAGFRAGAVEYVEEGRSGFRREAFLDWCKAHPDVKVSDPFKEEDKP